MSCEMGRNSVRPFVHTAFQNSVDLFDMMIYKENTLTEMKSVRNSSLLT